MFLCETTLAALLPLKIQLTNPNVKTGDYNHLINSKIVSQAFMDVVLSALKIICLKVVLQFMRHI